MDYESKPENPLFDKDVSPPGEWDDVENPPYGYYQYYTYANMTVLNHFRAYVDYKIFFVLFRVILYLHILDEYNSEFFIENKALIHLF